MYFYLALLQLSWLCIAKFANWRCYHFVGCRGNSVRANRKQLTFNVTCAMSFICTSDNVGATYVDIMLTKANGTNVVQLDGDGSTTCFLQRSTNGLCATSDERRYVFVGDVFWRRVGGCSFNAVLQSSFATWLLNCVAKSKLNASSFLVENPAT